MAFAHDSTRVIQCYIQFGNDEQRKQAFEELRGMSPGGRLTVTLYNESLFLLTYLGLPWKVLVAEGEQCVLCRAFFCFYGFFTRAE